MFDDYFNMLQWPAMVITLLSAWLVASQSKHKRNIGFCFFMVSNLLWIAWGWHDGAMALIGLQIGLFILNMRGVMKNNNPQDLKASSSTEVSDNRS